MQFVDLLIISQTLSEDSHNVDDKIETRWSSIKREENKAENRVQDWFKRTTAIVNYFNLGWTQLNMKITSQLNSFDSLSECDIARCVST